MIILMIQLIIINLNLFFNQFILDSQLYFRIKFPSLFIY